ncbi:MAG: NifB/NifX family molybdenum-iron cluster-binding protein [Candidatus Pacebacteria bacterium]|nr:NifB/NifX family molybdenum-iron cluster-binding protein [Candidatus Paceibacterota bacterium]
MKTAVSSTGKKLTDNVSEVFARCPYFVIAEIENQEIKKFEAMKNESENQMGGAGISAAQLMAEKNIKAVITKNVGPRALDVLKQFNIGIYYGDGAIEKVLQEFIDGKLEKMN